VLVEDISVVYFTGEVKLMQPIVINSELELHTLEPAHAEAMLALILNNREHLDSWLRWSGRIHTKQDVLDLIDRFAAKTAIGDGFHAGLWYQSQFVGGIVCHYMNRESNKTEIGYWLGAGYIGKGLVTQACRAVIKHLFEQEKMHSIEIQCVTDNAPSRAVAERLRFTFEGIKRDSEWITSAYRDHAIYSLLEGEQNDAK
jgi:ribosomal-protein-serine acetyltransferase